MNSKFFGILVCILFFGASIIPTISGNFREEDFSNKNIPDTEAGQNLFPNDPPEEEWNKTFGGPGVETGNAVQQTIDGGYIISGKTTTYGSGGEDIWLIKTYSNGNHEWNRSFGGSNNDWSTSVQQTIDDGYVITGVVNIGNRQEVWIIKTDSNGIEQWNRTFAVDIGNGGNEVQQTMDNGYIITGWTWSASQSYDIWLIKTDEDGIMEWNKTYGGSDLDMGHSVQQTDDDGDGSRNDGYIITGYTESFGAGGKDVWLIKTDINGNVQWSTTFGDLGNDFGYKVRQTLDGGYVVAGTITSIEDGNYDFWLIKTDSDGNLEWDKKCGSLIGEAARSIQQTEDGGYIIIGKTYNATGNGDIWLVKTDGGGNEEWNKTFGGEGDDYGFSVQQTEDNGYILSGALETSTTGDWDTWLIKLGSGNGNNPPDKPSIDGLTNGKKGKKYEYTFKAIDPEGDDIFYYIDWDDGNIEEWLGPYPSGIVVKVNHTWSKKGTYTVKAKAKDTYGAEGEWGTLEVTMPKNKPFIFNFPLLSWLFDRFPNAFPILRQLLEI